jgi:hypothetical protein
LPWALRTRIDETAIIDSTGVFRMEFLRRRRAFITLLGSAAAWPLAARAQQLAGKVPRIGFLQRIQNENVVAFIQGLRDAGYIDGQNAVIETRIFETTLDRLPDLANELVDLKCNVIVAASRYAFEAAMRATSTTPIVGIDLESDPVASGWAKSLGEYKALIGAGITKKDAARVVRDPGVKKGEWGWTCEDMMAVRVKADGAPGYPISSLVKYKNNVVCE